MAKKAIVGWLLVGHIIITDKEEVWYIIFNIHNDIKQQQTIGYNRIRGQWTRNTMFITLHLTRQTTVRLFNLKIMQIWYTAAFLLALFTPPHDGFLFENLPVLCIHNCIRHYDSYVLLLDQLSWFIEKLPHLVGCSLLLVYCGDPFIRGTTSQVYELFYNARLVL